MRPLFLTVEGIKSIAERQTVNFEKLAKNGIFGIFGKTGSGKSSILDAIILALYGEVIGKIDNSEFVNSNCSQAMVDLVFLAGAKGEKNKYRVRRSYKFDKNRTKLKQPEAFLWQITDLGEIPIAEGTKLVNPKIRDEIIGLEKEDFLKCIALPQGEFSAFVKLTRGDRLKVIGKLFNLQKYGKELYDKVRQKDNALFFEQTKLEGEMEALGNLDVSNFDLLENEYNQTKQDLQKIRELDNQNKKQLDIAKTVSNLLTERETKSVKLNEKCAYKPVIEGFKVKIKALDNALKVKQLIETCENSSNTLNERIKQLELLEQNEKNAKVCFDKASEKYLALENLQAQKNALIEKRAKVLSNEKLYEQALEKKRETDLMRKRYKALDDEIKYQKDNCLKRTKRIEQIVEELEKNNPSAIIKQLSSAVSVSGLNNFILQEVLFLNDLAKALSDLINNYYESAINALIAGHIQKIKALLTTEEVGTDVKEKANELLVALDKTTSLNGERERLLSENKSDAILIEKNQNEMAEILEKGKALSAEAQEFNKKIKELYGDLGYEGALSAVNKELLQLDNHERAVRAEYEKANESYANAKVKTEKVKGGISQLEQSLKTATEQLEGALLQNCTDLVSVKAILSEEILIERNRKTVDSFEKDVHALESSLADINVKISQTPEEYFNLQFFVEKCAKSENQLEEINKKYGEIKTKYEMGLKNKQRWCIIVESLKSIKNNRILYGKLIELFKFDRFMEYVAEEYLTEIATIAGRRVLELTNGRYGLLYKSQDNFYVTDNLKGGALRPVASLSGGETFLVSLSLALALSFKISSKAMRPIDFFFLDEGFGTLDEELINTVTDSLEKLHQSSLTVGLITHVAELKNRIQSKLYVSGATATHGTTVTESY